MRDLRSSTLLSHPAVRFLISGGIVAIISLSLTTTLRLTGTPFQIAFAVGYVCGIAVHFGLHRYFTFASVESYALGARSQAQRFVATVVIQYLVIAGGVALLSPLLGVPDLAVYFALIVLMSGANFLITRHRIFHGHSTSVPIQTIGDVPRANPHAPR